MTSADEITAIPNWQEHVANVAALIGTTFRNRRLLTKPELLSELGQEERLIVEWLYHVNPADFGSKLVFYGSSEPPKPNQFHVLKRYLKNLKGEPVLDIQYVPEPAFKAFETMNAAIRDGLGSELKISSAYRSPAFQALVACYNLHRHNYDIGFTFKYTALPGYSEHGLFPDVALDLQYGGEEYVRSDRVAEFAAAKEFKWLEKNAANFGFYLSFPKGNGAGLTFEPWHWRFKS